MFENIYENVDITELFDSDKIRQKELKFKLISDGTVDIYRKTSSTLHSFNKFLMSYEGSYDEALTNFKPGINQYDIRTAIELWSFFNSNDDTYKVLCNILRAYYLRVQRAKEFIGYLIKKPSVFLTLTFTDDVFIRTNENTRRKYVTRFLKSFEVPYIANVDYGEKNGREHYHCVLQVDKVDNNLWRYGLINFKKINCKKDDKVKLAKYINKLTWHSLKDSNKNQRVIYSSRKPFGYQGYLEGICYDEPSNN